MAAEWRPARAGDAAAIAARATATLGALGEDEAVYAERIALAPAGCLILSDGGRDIGHAVAHPWRGPAPALGAMLGTLPGDPDHWLLHEVAVDADARGGDAVAHAVALLSHAARAAGAARLALVAVGGTDRYWTRHGFVATEAADPGYGPGAVRMERGV